ncbi:putative transmembrane Protein [Thioalkalivibrio nitratireducens DSM 14787]|uniref:Transmembrane Protein n=1 Tax=Thioalkalivibrio nitratireducens (strain DSM 14787 / UNIQEM 213 / ALEN2) TaxID=1255043 RepID=L0DUI8_THIND|nr:hypothetical protein [Thioalkalivibrio nitratireducens]AGA32693.1 putative transmembrane Protein [Thioalkalivibrio nitratireducens DSM 14787]
MQKWVSVLWPSFVMSAVATTIVFLFLSPAQLAQSGGPALTTLGYYSVTFLFLWATTAGTTLISYFFQRPPESFNPD